MVRWWQRIVSITTMSLSTAETFLVVFPRVTTHQLDISSVSGESEAVFWKSLSVIVFCNQLCMRQGGMFNLFAYHAVGPVKVAEEYLTGMEILHVSARTFYKGLVT
uniref:Uncharacterized protein n=1 Tax=Daphnia galeata TaxID=27404 RepID=A0A8J2RPL4_9CRUS|nr:unnamed protein product [Daphnia galeata]